MIESYKYQALAAATSSQPTDRARDDGAEDEPAPASEGLSSGRKLKYDWVVNVGEPVVDIRVGRVSSGLNPNQVDILVLTDHHLFCLRENTAGGAPIRMQRRFDFYPAAMSLYALPGPMDVPSMHNIMLATHTQQLQVFKSESLVWSAKTQLQPVAVAVGEFGYVEIACLLTSSGRAGVSVVSITLFPGCPSLPFVCMFHRTLSRTPLHAPLPQLLCGTRVAWFSSILAEPCCTYACLCTTPQRFEGFSHSDGRGWYRHD